MLAKCILTDGGSQLSRQHNAAEIILPVNKQLQCLWPRKKLAAPRGPSEKEDELNSNTAGAALSPPSQQLPLPRHCHSCSQSFFPHFSPTVAPASAPALSLDTVRHAAPRSQSMSHSTTTQQGKQQNRWCATNNNTPCLPGCRCRVCRQQTLVDPR